MLQEGSEIKAFNDS